MKKVLVEFTLDELDLIGSLTCRDRDQVALPAAGYVTETQKPYLLTDAEEAAAPLHQSILKKICDALERDREKDLP